jgi:hypothetical protein
MAASASSRSGALFRARQKVSRIAQSYLYLEDGAVSHRGGRSPSVGLFGRFREAAPDASVADHRPHLIMPGFIDAAYALCAEPDDGGLCRLELLEWLNTYTFVEEQKLLRRPAGPCRGGRGGFLRCADPARYDDGGGLLLEPPALGRMPSSPRRSGAIC